MKRQPLLILGFLSVSTVFYGQEKKAVSPPTTVCTAGVPSFECKIATDFLAVMQQGSVPTSMVEIVIADTAAYNAEKDKASAITSNAPFLEAPFLFSTMDSFYKLKEPTGRLFEKVYLDETSSCHAPVIEGGIISKTKFGDYDSSQCTASLFYVLGFIEGAFLGANNEANRILCTIDKSSQDGKSCRKR